MRSLSLIPRFHFVGVWMLALVLTLCADASDAPLSVKDWVATRVRKTVDASNVVLGEFKLTNGSDAEISDISIVVSYQMADGQELKASEPTQIEKLAPRETRELAIQTGWAPNYECYEIRISYRDARGEQRMRWVGRGEQGQPAVIPSILRDAEPRVMILSDWFWWDKPNTPLQGVLRVKNVSPTPLEKLTAKITFDDGATRPKILGTWSGQLENGRLNAGEERAFKFPVPTAPKSYGKYRIEFSYSARGAQPEFARWNGGAFSGDGKVEMAYWNLRRPDADADGLAISVRVRNNLPQPVGDVALRLVFVKNQDGGKLVVREVTIQLVGEIPAGATQDMEISLKNFRTPFDDIERTILVQPKASAP